MTTQTLTVQGMTCGHCEKAVTTAIKTLDPQAHSLVRCFYPLNQEVA